MLVYRLNIILLKIQDFWPKKKKKTVPIAYNLISFVFL